MANKNLSYSADKERLLEKVLDLKNKAWKEMHEISGNDPKYPNRLIFWRAMDELFTKLGGH